MAEQHPSELLELIIEVINSDPDQIYLHGWGFLSARSNYAESLRMIQKVPEDLSLLSLADRFDEPVGYMQMP